ncbi:hypothetical protein F383_27196 [Gossypium arboreum]|uniref:Uncharacterized protein n=1 Tax=Gossypium arboreum TaxID=29729 RepID=A0A0B0MNW3_GOSAR|nr:hypothetical protein F383_27196 [Gossypium arboreum]
MSKPIERLICRLSCPIGKRHRCD